MDDRRCRGFIGGGAVRFSGTVVWLARRTLALLRRVEVALVIVVVTAAVVAEGPDFSPATAATLGRHDPTWTASETTLPANASSGGLDGILCYARGSCIAGGGYMDFNGNEQGLIETLSEGAWTPIEAPFPANAEATNQGVGIRDVFCLTQKTCEAVGEYRDSNGNGQGLIETLSEGVWVPIEAPLPANASATQQAAAVDGITCRSGGVCIGWGTYEDTNGNTQGLIETLSGGTWTAAEAPLPANASSPQFAVLRQLVCPATGLCVAFGQYVDPSSTFQPFFETLSGGTWTPTEAPLPANTQTSPYSALNGLSCAKSGNCLSAGVYTDINDNVEGFTDSRSGGVWTASEFPLPPNTMGIAFDGMACSTQRFCVAVGSSSETDGNFQSFIATRSATSWTAMPAPLPVDAASDPEGALNLINCPTKQFCLAFGSYVQTSGSWQAVMETMSGGTWKPSVPAVPINASSNPRTTILTVSCADAQFCVAIGAYDDVSGDSAGLIETLSHGKD